MFFVRTASRQDVPRVREILADTWRATYSEFYGADKVEEIIDDWHSIDRLTEKLDRPNSEFLVADNGEIVGGMAFAVQTDKVIKLHQLYVHPNYQGGKTGLHLMIEIENSFMDAEAIELEVEEKNTRAIGFYEKYGFSVNGRTENCGAEQSGIPALTMRKTIQYAED